MSAIQKKSPLPDLERKARLLLADLRSSVRQKGIKLGETYLRAKGFAGHGHWGDSCERMGVSTKWANKLIDFYHYRVQIGSDSRFEGLGIEASVDRVRQLHAPAEPIAPPHVSRNSGEVEWYTPPDIIERARRAMGGIDLDPASSAKANEVVQAKNFYAEADDGLAHDWAGRVWLNPPFKSPLVRQFIEKLLDSPSITAAVVVTNNATETRWGQKLLQAATRVCLPSKRIRFLRPDGTPGTPLQGQMVCALGDVPGFDAAFSDLGTLSGGPKPKTPVIEYIPPVPSIEAVKRSAAAAAKRAIKKTTTEELRWQNKILKENLENLQNDYDARFAQLDGGELPDRQDQIDRLRRDLASERRRADAAEARAKRWKSDAIRFEDALSRNHEAAA